MKIEKCEMQPRSGGLILARPFKGRELLIDSYSSDEVSRRYATDLTFPVNPRP
jgi:hypothetical protein